MTPELDKVEASHLVCERGGRLVLRDLDFSVARGEALALEGANGAGKTTALRVLAGLLSFASGAVIFHTAHGEVRDAEERGRFAGWLGHLDGIKNQLTVLENARFFAALYAGAGDVAAVLQRVGLSRAVNLPAQYLSAGQRRRLALARLILSERPVWLMDEPLSALDTGGKALIAELIREHCGANGIVIAATHDPLGVEARRLVMGPQ